VHASKLERGAYCAHSLLCSCCTKR